MADELFMNRKGISKIFEALCSTVILLIVISVFSQLTAPSNPYSFQAEAELRKLGYNVLQQMAIKGGIDNVFFNETTGELNEDWGLKVKIALQNILPKGLFFNLTVYNATIQDDHVVLQLLDENYPYISNFVRKFEESTAVGTTYIYTTKNIAGKVRILVFYLNLIRGESYG
ncbi:hypothetical protein DRN86_03435 [Candidatus Geothermarchaeota archaeon]|nr:MAG: hypothetical protein DRN86_03435 [Candidatus Geothermarchaeota archaeon]